MPQILLVLLVMVLNVVVMLISLKMDWLGILPTFIRLVGFMVLATLFSRTLIKRRLEPLPFLSFRAIVITISLLFCSMTSNVLFQFGHKQLLGGIQTDDSSKTSYEEQHGRTERVLETQLTENQANALSQAKRVIHEFIGITSEEVIYRWIILSALMMVLPPGRAVVLSSLVFAASHLVFPIALSNLEWGLTRLLPTFAIGVCCGVAYLWHGLPASIFVHFAGNLIRVFAFDEYDFIVDWILWGSASVTLFVLPLTLWFTRRRQRHDRFNRPATIG